MKHVMLALAAALLLAPAAVATQVTTPDEAVPHPVERVIKLLQGLMEKVTLDGQSEEVSYAKFEHWCANSEKSLDTAIAKEKSTIDELESSISAKSEEATTLSEQIDILKGEIVKLEGAGTAAKSDRSVAAKLYAEADKDFDATIQAITQAMEALQSAYTNTDGLLLAQQRVQEALALSGSSTTEEERQELEAFLGNATVRPELKAGGDFEGHTKKYAFKSSSVIELLKGLKEKFETEKLGTTKAETNSINAYELAKNARQDLINAADKSKSAKDTELSDTESDLKKAKQAKKDEEADLEADQAALAQTQKSCALKKTEWAERSETRTNELESMKAAVGILSKVTGVRITVPENPVPPPSPVSPSEEAAGLAFLQVVDPKQRAVQLLRAEARLVHSKGLDRLAQEISAHLSGPFDELDNMISKMIFHLMQEQKDEDDHKNWCDLELNKTTESKTNKEDKMEDLKTKIDAAQATVQMLSLQITDANEMVDTIAAHMKEAAEIRKAGKEENALATQDAQSGQTALANAIAVLETFYKDSGMVPKESWEFVQRDAAVVLPETPATWESSYTGLTDPTTPEYGIISVLKKVSANFAKMEADTRAQEETDQKAFEEDMKLCDIEKARRAKEAEEKSQEMKRQNDKIVSMQAMRKHVSDEHEAVLQYLKDLRPACIEGDSTYEERRGARAGEMDALRQAQQILKDAFKGGPAPAAAPPAATFLQRRVRNRVA
mmetsp:Transcript_93231/g.207377  ORF Transcript_93231/g.207377 Transcript_93231/m.207377 type:complete len:726 (-) Transcript_93231:46-2223(-)